MLLTLMSGVSNVWSSRAEAASGDRGNSSIKAAGFAYHSDTLSSVPPMPPSSQRFTRRH